MMPRNSNDTVYSQGCFRANMANLFTHGGSHPNAVITSTDAGTAGAAAYFQGRPCTSVAFDSTGSAAIQAQIADVISIPTTNDTFRFRTSLAWGDDYANNVGVLIGAVLADTTSQNDTVGSLPTDWLGLWKASTATAFTIGSRDDNGTAETLAVSGTLVKNVWYDIDVTAKRTGTNTGTLWVRVASSAALGGAWSTVNQGYLSVTTQFPDADTLLIPTLAFNQDATAAAATAYIGGFEWIAARGAR